MLLSFFLSFHRVGEFMQECYQVPSMVVCPFQIVSASFLPSERARISALWLCIANSARTGAANQPSRLHFCTMPQGGCMGDLAMCVYMPAWMHICAHTHPCKSRYIHPHMHAHAPTQNSPYACMRARTLICSLSCFHSRMHARTHT